jgi:hypothetical protein
VGQFNSYVDAVDFAQEFARTNRSLMMQTALKSMRAILSR